MNSYPDTLGAEEFLTFDARQGALAKSVKLKVCRRPPGRTSMVLRTQRLADGFAYGAQLGEGLLEFAGAFKDLGLEFEMRILEAPVQEANPEEVADAQQHFRGIERL